MQNNTIISFVQRYWRQLLFLVISILLVSNDRVYGIFGTLLYLPVLFAGSVVAALIIRHWQFQHTLDEDAHSEYFISAWHELDAKTRVLANLAVFAVLVLAASIIAAALIR